MKRFMPVATNMSCMSNFYIVLSLNFCNKQIIISVCFISVLYYTCVEEICDGKVEFDGSELTLLNMGSYIVSYEVLRDFMFHFLKGRYM